MNGLERNKLCASVFLAGIIALVCGLMSEALYHGGGGHAAGERRGYTIAGAENVSSSASGQAAAPETPVDIKPFLAKADLKAGEGLLKRCTSCHTFDKGGKDGVGPNQWGLVGGRMAHKENYSYSAALAGMKDKKWGFQELSDFLANPKKAVSGNKMAFAGMKDAQERANLIAYINTLSDNPLPLPK